ncbi:apoptotic chromatin condensation inducer in the nucleus [Tripterygium wilfordii]|uniref:Apoptotic chromatin condensation inducer in the nucleus n=1 Tax=Tripterygium wilfordii TaxID=458696 RepID=A0A7J7DLY8_TRIWF|nr:apoptotic chromatin condensation inducer in the nucleus-like [Tripterygium wilfordii]KAF5747380.1 apoptotic chromatin condensation inducer in the nucleus [Tripterygium wilfordii]
MSSQYPILENRPIDQWKVTELKEELKRRKLTTRGLKDDLIKRLAEALRIERENAVKEVDDLDPKPVVDVKNPEIVSVVTETVKDPVDNVNVQVEVNDGAPTVVQGIVREGSATASIESSRVEEGKLLDHASGVETSNLVTQTVATEVALNGQDMQKFATHGDNGNISTQLENEDPKPQYEYPKPQLENEDPKPRLENEDPKPQLENEDPKPQLENEDPKPLLENEDPKPSLENEGLKPPPEDPMLHSSAPNYQVSEVSPILGSPVKSDSISTDSVSINEKIELKDNIIDDNVKLEIDVVKPEMVGPSSSNLVAAGGESHPMDVEESHEKQASVEQKDDNDAVNEDMIRKNDSADVGYSEKLNLDRSSGDDSMEDDAIETKQIDSKYNDDELGDKSVKNELSVKEESIVDVVGDDLSADKKDILAEGRIHPAMPAEKRKLNDQEVGGNTEPLKRQRRWKSESLKVPEIQGSNLTPSTTPKDTFQSPGLKRNFSRSDSVSEDAPKERAVPPSPKPPTNSLRIDRFLRPFTLKAVQELLGKTGQVTDFWMDHIKTHCYVTYSSVEEAVETRNAVYNLKWPSNGGRLLMAEFVDPQEVKIRVETPQGPPQTAAVPVNTASTAPPAATTPQPSPSSRQQVSRQQLPPPPPILPPPPPLSNPSPVRERLTIPQPSEKVDPPIVTLDDLFRKTKATPWIYYLPLSEEQVAAKLGARSRAPKQ